MFLSPGSKVFPSSHGETRPLGYVCSRECRCTFELQCCGTVPWSCPSSVLRQDPRCVAKKPDLQSQQLRVQKPWHAAMCRPILAPVWAATLSWGRMHQPDQIPRVCWEPTSLPAAEMGWKQCQWQSQVYRHPWRCIDIWKKFYHIIMPPSVTFGINLGMCVLELQQEHSLCQSTGECK